MISARATQRLRVVLPRPRRCRSSAVLVNGQPATFAKQGFADVEITPADRDRRRHRLHGRRSTTPASPATSGRARCRPGSTTNEEWTAAGEPESSAWWFPANDHPSDPALMDVSVRVPAGMEAISVGRLESADTADETDFDTWHWIARQPMATYLNFISHRAVRAPAGHAGRPALRLRGDRAALAREPASGRSTRCCTSAERIATLETHVRALPVHRDRRRRAGAQVRRSPGWRTRPGRSTTPARS